MIFLLGIFLSLIRNSLKLSELFFFIRFYSFTPGYSKDHDEETFIPVEAFLNLKPGYQEVLLEPSKLTVPTWWREDYKDFKVAF